jgi:very-short-patch-repair endonuclease
MSSPRYVVELARRFRKQPTPGEEIFWRHVRGKQLHGMKFLRQHPIGRYIVDFYCAELKLVIELEGDIHKHPDQKEYDQSRLKELQSRGLDVMRFRNEEVVEDIQKVLEEIAKFKSNSPCNPSL